MTDQPRRLPPPPVHPLAAFAAIALDGVFAVVEILDPLLLLFTSLGVGLLGFLSTLFVQRFIERDTWGVSAAKGMVMGIVAGVPYPVMGTAIGVPLLVWSGLHQVIRLPSSGNNRLVEQAAGQRQPLLEDETEKEGHE